ALARERDAGEVRERAREWRRKRRDRSDRRDHGVGREVRCPGRRLREEPEHGPPELEPRAGHEVTALDACPVDERAVARAKILDAPGRPGACEASMALRHPRV